MTNKIRNWPKRPRGPRRPRRLDALLARGPATRADSTRHISLSDFRRRSSGHPGPWRHTSSRPNWSAPGRSASLGDIFLFDSRLDLLLMFGAGFGAILSDSRRSKVLSLVAKSRQLRPQGHLAGSPDAPPILRANSQTNCPRLRPKWPPVSLVSVCRVHTPNGPGRRTLVAGSFACKRLCSAA